MYHYTFLFILLSIQTISITPISTTSIHPNLLPLGLHAKPTREKVDEINVEQTTSPSLLLRAYQQHNYPLIIRNGAKHWPAIKQWNGDQAMLRLLGNASILRIETMSKEDPTRVYTPPENWPKTSKDMHVKDFINGKIKHGWYAATPLPSRLYNDVSFPHRLRALLPETVETVSNIGSDVDNTANASTSSSSSSPSSSSSSSSPPTLPSFHSLTQETIDTYGLIPQLWWSRGGTRSSLHYDPLDNLHCIVSGAKEFTIFPSKHVSRTHISDAAFFGRSNNDNNNDDMIYEFHTNREVSLVDVDAVDLLRYPGLKNASFQTIRLNAGDCLFLPYFWPHSVRSLKHDKNNIAVSFWWDEWTKKLDLEWIFGLSTPTVSNNGEWIEGDTERFFLNFQSGRHQHVSKLPNEKTSLFSYAVASGMSKFSLKQKTDNKTEQEKDKDTTKEKKTETQQDTTSTNTFMGWRVMSPTFIENIGLDVRHCNIDRIHASYLTKNRFETEYRNVKPLVITHLTDDWASYKLWTKKYFINTFGKRQVEVDDVKQFEDYGETKKRKTLQEYITNDMSSMDLKQVMELVGKKNITNEYSFYNWKDGEWNELEQDSPVPSLFRFINVSDQHSNQLQIGATGTGLFFHAHYDAWNTVIFGKKMWLISDPKDPIPAGTGLYATKEDPHCCNALVWNIEEAKQRKLRKLKKLNESNELKIDKITSSDANEEGENVDGNDDTNKSRDSNKKWKLGDQSHVYQCTVSAGETMYIPSHFQHATINLGDTISRSQRAGFGTVPDGHPLSSFDDEALYVKLLRWSKSTIQVHFEQYGRFRVDGKDGKEDYVDLNELLNRNALNFICHDDEEEKEEKKEEKDVEDEDDDATKDDQENNNIKDSATKEIRMEIYTFVKTIVRKIDHLLKNMLKKSMGRNGESLPSNMRDIEQVHQHIRDSHMQLRVYKTKLGSCYIKYLWRKKK